MKLSAADISILSRIVGRMHVSASDRGVRSTVGRKLAKSTPAELRQAALDKAVEIHHQNQEFFTSMRF